LFWKEEGGLVSNFVDKGEAFIRGDSVIFRPAKPRGLSFPFILWRSTEVAYGSDGPTDLIVVPFIEIAVGLRVNETDFDKNRWLVGIVKEEQIGPLLRSTVGKA
jgi:hypothetical protein